MIAPAWLRKGLLTAHIGASVGWTGAVVAYLVLDVTAATSRDPQTLRAAYVSMDAITRLAIVPLAFAALVTGIILALVTKWGLWRHWWVVLSLVLTAFAVAVLVAETGTIADLAETAADPTRTGAELRALPNTLLHSVSGLVTLIVIMALNVYKPKGLTPYGWRKNRAETERARHR